MFKYSPKTRRQYHSDREDKRLYHIAISAAGLTAMGVGGYVAYQHFSPKSKTLQWVGSFIKQQRQHIINEFKGITPVRPGVVPFNHRTAMGARFPTPEEALHREWIEQDFQTKNSLAKSRATTQIAKIKNDLEVTLREINAKTGGTFSMADIENRVKEEANSKLNMQLPNIPLNDAEAHRVDLELSAWKRMNANLQFTADARFSIAEPTVRKLIDGTTLKQHEIEQFSLMRKDPDLRRSALKQYRERIQDPKRILVAEDRRKLHMQTSEAAADFYRYLDLSDKTQYHKTFRFEDVVNDYQSRMADMERQTGFKSRFMQGSSVREQADTIAKRLNRLKVQGDIDGWSVHNAIFGDQKYFVYEMRGGLASADTGRKELARVLIPVIDGRELKSFLPTPLDGRRYMDAFQGYRIHKKGNAVKGTFVTLENMNAFASALSKLGDHWKDKPGLAAEEIEGEAKGFMNYVLARINRQQNQQRTQRWAEKYQFFSLQPYLGAPTDHLKDGIREALRFSMAKKRGETFVVIDTETLVQKGVKAGEAPIWAIGISKMDASGKIIDRGHFILPQFNQIGPTEARKSLNMTVTEARNIFGAHVQTDSQMRAEMERLVGDSTVIFKAAGGKDVEQVERIIGRKLKGSAIDLDKIGRLTGLASSARNLEEISESLMPGELPKIIQDSNQFLRQKYRTRAINAGFHEALVDADIEAKVISKASRNLLYQMFGIDASAASTAELKRLYRVANSPELPLELLRDRNIGRLKYFMGATPRGALFNGMVALRENPIIEAAGAMHQLEATHSVLVENEAALGLKLIRDTAAMQEMEMVSRLHGKSNLVAGQHVQARGFFTLNSPLLTQGATAIDKRMARAKAVVEWSDTIIADENSPISIMLMHETRQGGITERGKQDILAWYKKNKPGTPMKPVGENLRIRSIDMSGSSAQINFMYTHEMSDFAYTASWGQKGLMHAGWEAFDQVFDEAERRGYVRPHFMTNVTLGKPTLPYLLKDSGEAALEDLQRMANLNSPAMSNLQTSIKKHIDDLGKFREKGFGRQLAKGEFPMLQTMLGLIEDVKKVRGMQGIRYTKEQVAAVQANLGGVGINEYLERMFQNTALASALAVREGEVGLLAAAGGLLGIETRTTIAPRNPAAYAKIFGPEQILRGQGVKISSAYVAATGEQLLGKMAPDVRNYLLQRMQRTGPATREISLLSALNRGNNSIQDYSNWVESAIKGTGPVGAIDVTKYLDEIQGVIETPNLGNKAGRYNDIMKRVREDLNGQKIGYTTVMGKDGPIHVPIVTENLLKMSASGEYYSGDASYYGVLKALRNSNDDTKMNAALKVYRDKFAAAIKDATKKENALFTGVYGRAFLDTTMGPGNNPFNITIGYESARKLAEQGLDINKGNYIAYLMRDPAYDMFPVTVGIGKHKWGIGVNPVVAMLNQTDWDPDTVKAWIEGIDPTNAYRKNMLTQTNTLLSHNLTKYDEFTNMFKGVEDNKMSFAQFMDSVGIDNKVAHPGDYRRTPIYERAEGQYQVFDRHSGQYITRTFMRADKGRYADVGTAAKMWNNIKALSEAAMGGTTDEMAEYIKAQTGISLYYGATRPGAEIAARLYEARAPGWTERHVEAMASLFRQTETRIKSLKSGPKGTNPEQLREALYSMFDVTGRQFNQARRNILREQFVAIGREDVMDTAEVFNDLLRRSNFTTPIRATSEMIARDVRAGITGLNEEMAQNAGIATRTSAIAKLGKMNVPKEVMVGLGVLGLAYFFKPNQMKVLGEMPGVGGEANDYRGGRAELPFFAPVDIPEYTWDDTAKVTSWRTVARFNEFVGGLIPRPRQSANNDTSQLYAKPGVMTYNDKRKRMDAWNKNSVWRNVETFR